MRTASLSVVGVTFDNRQDVLARLYDDYDTEDRHDEVSFRLVEDPSNPVDPNAVAVCVVDPVELRGERVGFVPRDLAPKVARGLRSRRLIICDYWMGASRFGRVALKLMIGLLPKRIEDADGNEYDLEV